MIDVATKTSYERQDMQQELKEYWDLGFRLTEKGDEFALTGAVASQILETAITAIDVIERVEQMAQRFEADADKGGPAALVAGAIAQEIRNAMMGTRS